MSLKVKKSTVIHYLLIYILICFQGSMGFRAYNNLFSLAAFASAIYVIFRRRKAVPQHYLLFVGILFFSLILEIFLTNGGVYLSSIISIMARFAIALAAFYYDQKNFSTRVVKTVFFLACISIVGFVITNINSSLLTSLLTARTETITTYWKKYNVTYYGTFLFAFTTATARNIGIFHEPGLYQIVLSVSLYLLLFKGYLLNIARKTRLWYLVIISITMLTTMSTTGLIGMVGLYAIYFLFFKGDSVSPRIKWGIVAAVGAVAVYEIFAGENSYLNKHIFSKIVLQNGQIDLTASTGNSRVLSLLSDLTIFKNHPFGIGYLEYNAAFKDNLLDQTITDTSSCVGFTQVLAVLGILVFIVIMFYYMYLIKKNLKGAEVGAFLFLFVNTGLSQPYIWFPAIVVLLLINDKRYFRRA